MRRLSGRRAARLEAGQFVIEGAHLVREALDAGVPLVDLFADERHQPDWSGLPEPTWVADGVLDRVLDAVTPQGVAAVADLPATSVAEVLAATGPVVVLDQVNDPGNVGTILRSVEAAGGAGVVLVDGSADPFQPKVVRSAAGSLFRLPVATGPTADISDLARAAGRPLVVTVMRQGDPYPDVDIDAAVLVVGNEAHGVSDALLAAADQLLHIPMAGATESLNVAMATTVVLFDAARRRGWS